MNKKQVQQFLKENKFRPIKKLGQNFLINQDTIYKIVHRVQKYSPPFVEVGPGPGSLSRHFENKKKQVLLIEKDKKLANYWRQNKWNVICADVLKLKWENLPKTMTLFGNLPYEIAGTLIVKSCLHQKQIPNMILTMQKELAQRASASPQSKNYGLLSIMSHVFWNMELIANIPKTDFYPIPKVDGRVLEFQAKKRNHLLEPSSFLKFVKQCFSFKRKMLFKQISCNSVETAKKTLMNLNLSATCRAEELSPNQFVQLYLQIKSQKF